MARIQPAPSEHLAKYEEVFTMVEGQMGFVPASLKTMAHVPEILDGFLSMMVGIGAAGRIDPLLSQLIAHVTSTANGCTYCQAHTGAHAAHIDGSADKVEAVWEFETSDLFTDAERSALRLARDAGLSPNSATDAHFEELAQHYEQDQIVHIVAVISAFGFLNRWNDTVATTLESAPAAFATEHLSERGWSVGKHA